MENLNQSLAILIDADNASSKDIEEIFKEIASRGVANVRKIYGNWSKDAVINNWTEEIIMKYALVPVQQFDYVKGKDATDMQLIIDAMDLLYREQIDGFVIVSSDSDFTPLVARLRQSGKRVYGIGRKQTPFSLINSCNEFIYIDDIDEHKTNNKTELNSAKDLNIIRSKLYEAIKNTMENDGWSKLDNVSLYMKNLTPDFSPKSYGYASLSKLLKDLAVSEKNLPNIQLGDNNRYCRKIPLGKLFLSLEKLIPKYQDKNGFAEINKLEPELKSLWNFEEYGYKSLIEALNRLYNIVIKENRLIKIENKNLPLKITN